jgi:hypothetical protein
VFVSLFLLPFLVVFSERLGADSKLLTWTSFFSSLSRARTRMFNSGSECLLKFLLFCAQAFGLVGLRIVREMNR